jgi:hypothetical protein
MGHILETVELFNLLDWLDCWWEASMWAEDLE